MAILLNLENDLNSEQIVLNNTGLEVVLVKMFYPFNICNIYLIPNLRVTTSELNNVIKPFPTNTFYEYLSNVKLFRYISKHAKVELKQIFHIWNSLNEETYIYEITFAELEHALAQCKGFSPGPDGIPCVMIKHLLMHEMKYILSVFFNKIWKEQCFPEMWVEALVIPIWKPNKKKLNAKNYRPISLTNCLCKLMQKIVKKRLVWYFRNRSTWTWPFNYELDQKLLSFLVKIQSNSWQINIRWKPGVIQAL